MKSMREGMDLGKKAAGQAAAELVQDGMIVGLGTGSTAYYFIMRLAERCRQGLKITAIATSAASEKLAKENGIALVDASAASIDFAVDGADEIDFYKRMVKGGGGALLREKVVAQCAKELVIVIDSAKQVEKLGKFGLPVAILPFGHAITIKQIEQKGYMGALRCTVAGALYTSDDGLLIYDIKFDGLRDSPEKDHESLIGIAGVMETGLFLGLAPKVIIGLPDGTCSYLN